MMKAYSEYKDSGIEWIGEIPEHWEIKKLKFASSITLSGVDKKTIDGETVVRLCNYTDVYYNEYINDKFDFMVASASQNEIARSTLAKDDVIITKDSETPDDIAVPTYVESDLKNVLCGYHLAQLRTLKSSMSGKYLFQLLAAKTIRDQYTPLANGITRFGVGKYAIDNSIFTVPPLSEQQSITNFLDRKTRQIDTLIEKKRKMIELLKEERTAVINHAVTKGLNPDVKMKASGIEWLGKIPEHWEVKRLKHIALINPSKSSISALKDDELLVTFLPMEKVSENGLLDQTLKKPIKELWSGFTFFAQGDVLIAKITPCFENGKGACLDCLESTIGFGSTEFHVIRAIDTLTISRYLYLITYSHLFRKMGEAFMAGAAGQKRVSMEFLENFIIPIPSIKEQYEIVDKLSKKLDRLDVLIKEENQFIELLQEYRTALISEAVTGKIDVRDEVMA